MKIGLNNFRILDDICDKNYMLRKKIVGILIKIGINLSGISVIIFESGNIKKYVFIIFEIVFDVFIVGMGEFVLKN